jgi:hypothetical protein
MRSKAPAALLLAVALVTSCSGGGKNKASSTPTPSPTPSATPTVAPKPTPVPADYLTGLTPRRTGPVVAIKVDNAVLARPYQRGLKQASLVYQELVEGGSTRLLAVMQSDAAGNFEVGPIRSVRESDIDLLRQFGGIDVGFSGGNTGVKSIFRHAAAKGYVIDASYDAVPSAYRLGEQRRDARNFFATADTLTKRHPGKGPVDIGLRFSKALPGIGILTPVAKAVIAPDSVMRIRYDVAAGSYVMSEGGNVLPVSPANVVIQYVKTRQSGFRDVHGQPTPFTVSTGSGRVVILRDGRRFAGTWSRSGFGATSFKAVGGKDLALKPGPTWVILLPQTGALGF